MDGDTLPLTHELLGIMLGVRRSSVTEVLQSLQKQGYLDYSRGKIEIQNRQGLEDTSCECYQTVRSVYQDLLW
jgi:DNA-binding FadR family transcriptional regulator